jgi:hypothetical protein
MQYMKEYSLTGFGFLGLLCKQYHSVPEWVLSDAGEYRLERERW